MAKFESYKPKHMYLDMRLDREISKETSVNHESYEGGMVDIIEEDRAIVSSMTFHDDDPYSIRELFTAEAIKNVTELAKNMKTYEEGVN